MYKRQEPFSGKSAMVLGIAKKLLQKKKKVRIGKPLATCIELTNLPSISYEGFRAGNISASDVFIQILFLLVNHCLEQYLQINVKI